MTLAAGSRLGPYEIVAPIGAGGMGEVYRARDPRLERAVAIKVLSPEFAENAQLRLRFEREAKTISQLNHPNICTLHDVGHESGIDYLVMELVEGESLADRVTRGPVPMGETLRIGAQIAAALDRAHRAGIVHRDLKPGNVMLTKSGAKLLDFGLAKSGVFGVSADGATQQKPLTQEGTILGTFQYMAPEQLEGADADPRTDIFALGALLYEMATGRRAFQGTSKTSLIAAIVAAEPQPISQLQPLTPLAFEHVVTKCLAKDPEARWQSAHDVAEELRWISEAGSSAGVAAPVARRKKRFALLGWVAAAVVTVAAVAVLLMRKPPPLPRTETAIVVPDGVALSYVAGSIALSADGRQLAFVARAADGKQMIWVRPLDSSAARPVAGTEGGAFPFWSPDGRYIAFVDAGHKLQKIGVAGGAPDTITDAPDFAGGTWGTGGDILFSDSRAVLHVSPAGGKPVQIVKREGARSVSAPIFLPDGKHFLFTAFRGTSEAEGVFAAALGSKEETLVLPKVYSNTAYAPQGYIVYSREGDLRTQPFDIKTLKVSGDPVRLADRVLYDADTKAALFSVAGDGSLVYVAGEGAGKTQLTWVGRDGKDLGTIAPPAMYYSPRLSHDEKRVAVDLSDTETAKGDIWIFDIAHKATTRLTYDPSNESSPQWSPDDRRITYFSEKAGHLDLYERPSSGTGAEQLIFADKCEKVPLDISPDGTWLAYRTDDVEKKSGGIWIMETATRKVKPHLTTPFHDHGLQFSPDGKWIAWISDESGITEVYVQQFPEPTGKWIVSRGGGTMPQWAADGRSLYYVSRDRKMMAVPITLGASPDAGAPVALFDAHVREGFGFRQYAATRDGSRFLLNRTVGEEGTRPMTYVQNWTSSIAGK